MAFHRHISMLEWKETTTPQLCSNDRLALSVKEVARQLGLSTDSEIGKEYRLGYEAVHKGRIPRWCCEALQPNGESRAYTDTARNRHISHFWVERMMEALAKRWRARSGSPSHPRSE